MIYLQSCMYYKKNLEQWFKLKRKREFWFIKKRAMLHLKDTGPLLPTLLLFV